MKMFLKLEINTNQVCFVINTISTKYIVVYEIETIEIKQK